MALVDEIAVKLGISTAQFKAALKDADASVKSFKKGGEFGKNEGFGKSIQGLTRAVGQFRALITGGGILIMLRSIFQTGAEWAEKHRDSVDENVQAYLRLRDAVKLAGEKTGEAIAKTGGFWENIVIATAQAVGGMKAVAAAVGFLHKATVEALAIEQQKEAKALAKTRRDIAYEEADANGKIGILMLENINRQIEQNKLKKDSVAWLKMQGEIDKANAEIKKQAAEDEKSLVAEEKKQREELKKIHEESVKYAQESAKLDKELAKIAFEKLDPEKQLASLRRDEARLTKEIKDANLDENVIKQKKIDLDGVQKKIREAVLGLEGSILTAEEQELEVKKRVTAEDEKQLRLLKDKLVQTVQLNAATLKRTNVGEDSRLTDRQLEEKIANLRRTISDAEIRRARGDSVYIDPTELNKAEEEQDLRRRFRSAAQIFGTEKALTQFSAFDEDRLRALVEGRDLQKETVTTLKSLQDHFVKYFPL